MILASYLYDTVRTIIRKDQHGNSFNITEYNNIIQLINYELYNSYAANVGENLENTEALKDFMKLEQTVALVSGVGNLPTGYERMLGKPHWKGILGADWILLDVANSLEMKDRRNDPLTEPDILHPVAIIGGAQVTSKSQITVYPTTIPNGNIYIDYLTIPATPFLDYYVASTGLYVYMIEGATAVNIPAGAVYRDGTAGGGAVTKDSITVNFEWHADQTPILSSMILQKAGLAITNQVAIEYGIAKETKAETQ